MSVRPQILFYESQHYYLSNFSAFSIKRTRPTIPFGIEKWMTVEHAYQAWKFKGKEASHVRNGILRAPSAHEAKQIAKANKHLARADWDEIKLAVMEELLRLKFDQHEFVSRMLLSTGDTELVEDSPKDGFWGRGPDWKGQNHLGRLWMKIREEMQKQTGV